MQFFLFKRTKGLNFDIVKLIRGSLGEGLNHYCESIQFPMLKLGV
jgi:hypothetical protein